MKEEGNLEDDTCHVVCIFTLFRKPSLYEKYLVLLVLGLKEPRGNGDFNAGYSGVKVPSKSFIRNLLPI